LWGGDNRADLGAGHWGGITTPTPSGPLDPPADSDFAKPDISRNARCPGGSGQKYKHCHGALA